MRPDVDDQPEFLLYYWALDACLGFGEQVHFWHEAGMSLIRRWPDRRLSIKFARFDARSFRSSDESVFAELQFSFVSE